jgi:uncharacterized ferredoxin-like protein
MAVVLNPETEALADIGRRMCVAARTAPKACGIDQIVTALVTDPADLAALVAELERLAQELGAPFFARDARNLREAPVCVLIGTKLDRRHVPGCDLCGFPGCEASEAAGARCAMCVGDLGIALGSAASVAADCRADNRIMYTVGLAAVRLGLLGEEVRIVHALPLCARGKNIFFDRK